MVQRTSDCAPWQCAVRDWVHNVFDTAVNASATAAAASPAGFYNAGFDLR
jgi:hypothetical protein